MTGKQALINASALLGRVEMRGAEPDIAMLSSGMTALNCIYADLHGLCSKGEFEPLFTLDDKICLPENVLNDCFVYGVAYMLSEADEDFEKMNRFCKLYNNKRAKCGDVGTIKDSIFEGCDLYV